MSNGPVAVRSLSDGGQQAQDIASMIAEFVDGAQSTLDLALYDLFLSPPVLAVVAAAFQRAVARRVAVRLVLNSDHPGPIPVPPPPKFNPHDPPQLPVPTRLVPGIPDLMHHKYIVRDRTAVWTGSTNWTDDSWTREENVIVRLSSPQLAQAYAVDFSQLWDQTNVAASGNVGCAPADLGGGCWARVWFCPAEAPRLVHRMGGAMARARRIRIASPVLTSGPILGTLAEIGARGQTDIAGVLDATQMKEVYGQWGSHGSWKLGVLREVLEAIPFTGKVSVPYAPGSLHNYMHAKIMVADDIVFAGSFNLSHSGELNAENVVEMFNPAVAAQLADWIDETRRRFPPVPPPP